MKKLALVMTAVVVARTASAQPVADDIPAEPAPAPAEAPVATPAPVLAQVSVAPEPAEPAAEKPPAFTPWSTARFALDLELTSHARYASKPGTNLSEVRLDRGELGARLALGAHGAAELRLEAIRSAVDGGALGIDGDSMVARIRYARVMAQAALGPVALDGSLGFVPDPWIRALEEGYPLKPLSRTGTERLLGWPTSDLAALVRGTVGPARLSIAVGNGEGQRYPERNTGKTTTAVAEVVALHTQDVRVSVAAVVRDGSIGVARVRDRRAGGGATVVTPWVRGGVEAVKAWGIGDRGDAEGLVVGGWAEGRVVNNLFVAARAASLGFSADGRLSTFGGAVAVEPWRDGSGGRLRLWLAVDRVTSSGSGMPVPGADAGDATVAMLILSAVAPFVLD